MLTVMNAAATEKFTATADLLVEPKSALHTLPLRAKYEPPRLERVELKSNNHGGKNSDNVRFKVVECKKSKTDDQRSPLREIL